MQVPDRVPLIGSWKRCSDSPNPRPPMRCSVCRVPPGDRRDAVGEAFDGRVLGLTSYFARADVFPSYNCCNSSCSLHSNFYMTAENNHPWPILLYRYPRLILSSSKGTFVCRSLEFKTEHVRLPEHLLGPECISQIEKLSA